MVHFLARFRHALNKLLLFQRPVLARASVDPMLLYGETQTEKKSLVFASIVACLFHLTVFLIVDFPARHQIFQPARQVLILAKLVEPRTALAPGGLPRPAISLKSAPKPAPVLVPIPDPTPDDPEPIRRADVNLIPPIVRLTGEDLTVGSIGPPSDVPGQPGYGSLDQADGDGTGVPGGTGEGGSGPDISVPVLISHRLPQYTDEAIKAHVEGVVFLQVVIRKNGKADSFQVVRGLGHGLEERAIQEIARSWMFRPATRRGVAIDYPTLIEVTFSLR